MWMKTGIFQSNAGLTRCIGNLITVVWMSPVDQREAKAPDGKSQPPLCKLPLASIPLYAECLCCGLSTATGRASGTEHPDKWAKLASTQQFTADGSGALYPSCPHERGKLRISKYCQNLSARLKANLILKFSTTKMLFNIHFPFPVGTGYCSWFSKKWFYANLHLF